MANIHERIKERRLACGLTLLQVADAIGVKEATVQRYESGEIKNIKYETVLKLSAVLRCKPAYLFGWMDDDLFRHLENLCNKKGIAFSDAMQQAGFTEKEIEDYYAGQRGVIFSRKDALCKVLGDDPDKWSTLVFSDNIPTDEKRKPASQDVPERNIVRIAGRNGTFEERYLTDEQLAALEAILQQMPKIEDDNL